MSGKREKNRIIYKGLYCFIITLILTVPLFFYTLNRIGERVGAYGNKYNESGGWKIFNEIPLSGVETKPDLINISFESVLNGEFQSKFEKYFAYSLPWRMIMTRIYNQILRTCFNSTDSSSIVIGKNNTLYEKNYIQAYLKNINEDDKSDLLNKILKLQILYDLLKDREIPLIVSVTPSKASIYTEDIPYAYDRYTKLYKENYYDYFSQMKREFNFPVIDLHAFFVQMKSKGDIIFTKGGTHWTYLYVHEYINSINSIIYKYSNKNVGSLELKSVNDKFGNAFHTDNDIENLLNDALVFGQKYYSPHVTLSSNKSDFSPNLFISHGSFFWTLLDSVYNLNEIQKDMDRPLWGKVYSSFYNGKFHRFEYDNEKKFSTKTLVSNTTIDYGLALESDVIIVEFNEEAIYPDAPQFIFVDNMINYLKGEL